MPLDTPTENIHSLKRMFDHALLLKELYDHHGIQGLSNYRTNPMFPESIVEYSAVWGLDLQTGTGFQ